MERHPVLTKIASWQTLVSGAFGALVVMFLVYPPSPHWGASEKWGDVAGWVGAIGTFIAAGITIWAVLESIAASRAATITAFQLRELDGIEENKKTIALRTRLAVMFRSELFLLGGMYALFRAQLLEALHSGDRGEMRYALEHGLPNQGLRLIDRFAGELHVFPGDVAVHVAIALSRWHFYLQSPPAKGIEAATLPAAFEVTINSLDLTIRDLRIAHSELGPFMPPEAIVGDDEKLFSDLSREYRV